MLNRRAFILSLSAGVVACPRAESQTVNLSDEAIRDILRRRIDVEKRATGMVVGIVERGRRRVIAGYLSTDEFAFIFERSFRDAAENYQHERLDAFRGILVNAATRNDIKQEDKEYFLVLASIL